MIRPASVAPLPPGPTEPASDFCGPRAAVSPIGDLVAITCPDSNTLAFYDDELGTVTAVLPNIGNLPFAMASSVRTVGVGSATQVLPGIRLFVTDFGSGQIAVVDVPDLLDASSAVVVAFIGSFEDTSASPINPNNSVLNVAVGSGPTGDSVMSGRPRVSGAMGHGWPSAWSSLACCFEQPAAGRWTWPSQPAGMALANTLLVYRQSGRQRAARVRHPGCGRTRPSPNLMFPVSVPTVRRSPGAVGGNALADVLTDLDGPIRRWGSSMPSTISTM